MKDEQVTFILDGFPCQGNLHIEGNSFYLDLEKNAPIISYNPRKIVCSSKTQTYVFYQNVVRSHRVLPRFVIYGIENPRFSCVEFDLDGLQDFLSFANFNNGLVFKETVEIEGEKFVCECHNNSKKTIVNLKTYFRWDDVCKIENIVLKFVQLFSLLSYKRIKCSSIRILDGNCNYEFKSFTCGSFEGDKERHKSLLSAAKICWERVLNNFFQDESGVVEGKKVSVFDECLTLFIAQIDSDLFWDYKALSICGILDHYTKLIGLSEKNSFSSSDVNYVEQIFTECCKQQTRHFSNGERNVIEDIRDLLDSRKRYGDASLYGRFCELYESLDERIRKIFPDAKSDMKILGSSSTCVGGFATLFC